MAISKCRECGREVSDQAKVCPGCGIKKPIKKTSIVTKIIAVIFGVAAINSLVISNFRSTGEGSALINSSEKKLSIKDLTTGVPVSSIDSLKNLKPISSQKELLAYEFDYFGGKPVAQIKIDSNGNIYGILIILSDPISKIKPALEEKISKENGRPISFSCSESKTKPDSGTEFVTEECKISHSSQVLTLSETEIKSTRNTQLPIYTRHIDLTDTKLKAEENSRKNEERAVEQRKIDMKKRSDI